MSLKQDVLYAIKAMRRSPRVGVTVLLTLALGIGANTAIFSIVNAALLRPLPYHDPGELVQVYADLPGVSSRDVGFSVPEYDDLRDRSGLFQQISVSWQGPANLTGGAHPERVDFLAVHPNYFSMLGTAPQLGRLFDARDTANGFAEATVISDAYWHKEFGGDPHVLGRSLRLDTDLYTIVGILPADFRPPTPSTAGPVDCFITAGFRAAPFPLPNRSLRLLPAIIGRLKPGISVEQAQAQIAVLSSQLRHDYADDYPASSGWTLRLVPLKDVVVGNTRTMLISLELAVAFILLIACVNVANILLASGSARQRELAVRLAMGATRRRLIRQLLTESAVLSLAAAVIGILVAGATLRALAFALPTQLPHVNSIGLDARVLCFSLGVALLTTIGFGLVPALESARTDAEIDTLRGRGASRSARETRIGKVLVAGEVALSVMLLVGAGLLLRTFWDLLHVDTGFETRHLVAASIWLPVPNHPELDVYRDPLKRLQLIQQSLHNLEAQPGVEGVAIADEVPFEDINLPVGFRAEGMQELGDAPAAVSSAVTPGFFKTLGIPLMSGRFFTDTDTGKFDSNGRNQAPALAVVDEAAVQRFWNGQNPVGRRIRYSGTEVDGTTGKPVPAPWMTVIGVVGNARLNSLDEQMDPHIYRTEYQFPDRQFGVLVRATGNTAEIGRTIERAVQAIDPNLPIARVTAMREIEDSSVGDRRFAAWLLGIFAAVALLLTSVGIYGVTAYAIARRTKELGIRSALGASRRDLERLVLLNGMTPILVGLACGFAGAILGARLIAALLYHVSTTDGLVLAATAATVVLVGVAANYIPARRAAKIDPMIAMRVD